MYKLDRGIYSSSLKQWLQATLIASMMSAVVSSVALAQSAEDYLCGKEEDIRRIEIRFEDDSGQLPCRVVYRPETESDSVGTVSWRGINRVDECKAQALQVVERLTAEGWSCAFVDHKAKIGDPKVIEVNLTAKTTIPTDDEQTIGAGLADEEFSPEPVLLENPDLEPPSPELAFAVEEDLAKLAATLDGRLEAKIISYEDLNTDGISDALTVLTYASPQPAYRQFLTAYFFDGEAYQLAATRLIASSSTDTLNAALDEVDQGIIKLSLEAYRPGDKSCCPSGVEQLSLALRGLELVEIDKKVLTR